MIVRSLSTPTLKAVDANVASQPALASLQRAQGAVRLSFKRSGDRTRIDDLFQQGCLKARLPRTGAKDPAAVLVNTSGGLTDRDQLSIETNWQAETSAVVTTQACERIYKSRAEPARIETRLSIGANASAYWLPQESILFDSGQLARKTSVKLTASSRLLACEAVIFGRPAMGESVRSGLLRDSWRIEREGKLVFADQLSFSGDPVAQLNRASIGAGARAIASVIVCAPDSSGLCDVIRPFLDRPGITAGCSDLGGVVLTRLLAPSGYRLRATLIPLLERLRGGALPRVWTC